MMNSYNLSFLCSPPAGCTSIWKVIILCRPNSGAPEPCVIGWYDSTTVAAGGSVTRLDDS